VKGMEKARRVAFMFVIITNVLDEQRLSKTVPLLYSLEVEHMMFWTVCI
jgi:hypothetical protein